MERRKKMHRKSRFLAMILLLLMIFMTGCGRSKDSERTAEDYYEKQSGSVDERLDNAENSDINSVYDRTMKKLENNDFEKMEGTDIFNKIFRSFYGGIYRIYLGFKAAAPVLLVLGVTAGALMAKFCTENKRLQRFGISLVFFTIVIVVGIVFGGGYINSKILG